MDTPFAHELLLHDEAHLRIKAVCCVTDVNLFAEYTAVFNLDSPATDNAAVLANIDVIADDQFRLKRFARGVMDGTEP